MLDAIKDEINENSEPWKVSGPELLNRMVQAAETPITILPRSWVYTHPWNGLPGPMQSIISNGVMWGEVKPEERPALWGNVSVPTSTSNINCSWNGRSWLIRQWPRRRRR